MRALPAFATDSRVNGCAVIIMLTRSERAPCYHKVVYMSMKT